jgi:hypothetical protein
MATIEKKAWPAWFEAVRTRRKKYDFRLGDLRARVGDVLVLREWDPRTKAYTGRKLRRTITYVSRTRGQKFWPKKLVDRYGFILLSLR